MKNDSDIDAARDLLVFSADGRHFAVDSALVVEIAPVMPVTPLPFTEEFVSGLANVSGQVLPQIQLKSLLNGTPADTDYGELIIVNGRHSPCAIAVDKVHEGVVVDAESISAVTTDGDSGTERGFVLGEFQWREQPTLLLSGQELASLVLSGEPAEGEAAFLASAENSEAHQEEDHESCLKLRIGAEAYVLPMTDAVEIVESQRFSPVPGAPGFIRGLTLVRQQTLLVVSAGGLLGLGESGEHAIVVVDLAGLRLGISVGAVESALSVPSARIRRFKDPESRLAGVVEDDCGELLGLLSTDRLLTANERQAVSANIPRHRHVTGQEQIVITRSVLEVVQGDQYFGIPVSNVDRIIDYQTPRPLPSGNDRIAGAIEYDSRVLPVLSGDVLCPVSDENSLTAFVVLSDDKQRQWALPVQQASRIRDIDEGTIKPLEKRDGGLVREVAQFEGRLLSMVNAGLLGDMERPDPASEPAT